MLGSQARPTVSIVTALYNKAAYVAATARSVLAQDFDSFEWVVVDDGSTDGSTARLPDDPRIRVIHQENAGMAAALNRGVAEARGEFVTFLDADDAFLPGKLASQFGVLRAHPDHDWVLSGVQSVSAEGTRSRLPLGSLAPQGAVVALRDAFQELDLTGQRMDALLLRVGVFQEAGGMVHDATPFDHVHFFSRLVLVRPRGVVHQEVVSRYDVDVQGSLYKNAMRRVEGRRALALLLRGLARRHPRHRMALRRRAEQTYCQYVRGLGYYGHRRRALRDLLIRYRGSRGTSFLAALGRLLLPEPAAVFLKAARLAFRGRLLPAPPAGAVAARARA